jgi:putative redox protein
MSTAPTPFATFLASLGTCAGFYVLGFCQQRGIPTEGIRIIQRVHKSPNNGMLGKIEIEIQVPSNFPQKYYSSLVRSAELCAVKKHFEQPPQFEIYTSGSVGTELAIMSGKKSTQKRQGEANDQTKKRPTTHIDRRRTGMVGTD